MNTWGIIEDRIKALDSLYRRMDETKDLVYMTDFHLMGFDGKVLNKVVNVTGNKGASYAHRVVSSLIAQGFQTVVEGDISKRDAHKVEDFLNANFDQTDVYLSETYGIPDLYSWLCNHVCIRGAIGAEWVSWIDNGEYKTHCLPCDMRYTPFVLNKWVAPVTFRMKDDLEVELEEYEKKAKDGWGEYTKITLKSDEDNEARDFWDGEKNELWVNKQIVYTQPNTLEKPPFVIVFPPVGFMLRDKGFLEHEGEDIFFLIRKLDRELNRTLSVEQTFAFRQLYPAYEYETENYDTQPSDAAPETGEVDKRRKGELHQVVETGDMNRASQVARQDILNMMDEGAPLQPRAYTQPPSAVEVATEVELINQLQQSRIVALQMFRSNLCRMMIDQFIKITEGHKGELLIGQRGKRKQFSVAQLKDPERYSITSQLTGTNKRLQIVNESRALALWGRAPLKYILQDVLMVEDPDGWMRELDLQQARQADPALALFEMGVRYAEEAEEMSDEKDADLKKFQSMMLIERGIAMVKQRMQPAPMSEETREPKVPEQKGSANALLPLLGRAGAGVSPVRQPMEVTE